MTTQSPLDTSIRETTSLAPSDSSQLSQRVFSKYKGHPQFWHLNSFMTFNQFGPTDNFRSAGGSRMFRLAPPAVRRSASAYEIP
jgi:hypothetical protein